MFLRSSGLALVASGVMPNVFLRMASAGTTQGRKVLVTLFQRGAVDGLNVVVPYGESAYYAARPTIAIPRPGAAGNVAAAIDLDGFFGLHPAMSSLAPFFRDRSAAFVQAVGSPDTSRSHFDAQDFMESGTPGVKSTEDGFLSRAITEKGVGKDAAKLSPLRAVALSSALPRILAGKAGAVAMTSLGQFGIRGGNEGGEVMSQSFESMYAESVAGALGGTAKSSFEAARILKSADPQKLQPENGAIYPATPLGDSLKQIAQLIKSNVGLEVAFADVGGWDTHAGEEGQLANNLRKFADAIAAFTRDLGSRMGDVVLVTTSEFGRTVHENGNRGTDHGHANQILVLGGGVRGGKVYGRWPGLGAAQLFENRDLALTTDFRDIFGELLTRHLGVASLKSVFPGYEAKPSKWRGLMS
jgi:uncharacterized protein (DUF1501 family)